MSLTIDDADPRSQAWRLFIETSARLTTAIDEQLRSESEMTLSDFHVMLILSEAPDQRLRMKEIAQRMVFTASRLTYQVDTLCKRGWLRREKVPQDGRGSYAILTAEGRAVFEAAARGHRDLVNHLFFTPLSRSDGQELVDIMTRLAEPLDRME